MSSCTRGLLLIAAVAAGCAEPTGERDAAPTESAAPAGQARNVTAEELLTWPRTGEANWRAADNGAVQADAGAGGFLVSPESYGDFDVSVEFWVSPDANSGVFVRCADSAAPGAETCYEVNIFDSRPDPTYRTGSIVGFAPPKSTMYTGGRWNRFEISARGPRIAVTLNDRPIVELEDERFAAGPIALQYGSGTVLFRNLRITPR